MNFPGPLKKLVDRLVKAWHRRAIVLKAISYATIGVINMMVDFLLFFVGYALAGLPLVLANIVSWSVAVSGSYVMNSYITFAHESGRQLGLRAYITFASAGVGGLIVNTTTLVVCSWYMPIWAAKAAATLVGFLVNFSMSYFVVFPRHRQPARDAGAMAPRHSARVSNVNEGWNP